MRYADATRCPDCRAVLAGRLRCAVCGFDVESPEVPAIWDRLQEIDELVAAARARLVVPPPPAPADATAPPTSPSPPASTSPPAPGSPVVPPPPLPSSATGGSAGPAGSGVSAGSVVLGLGAALLVLAAVIFVSFAWSVVGIGGRAAILGVLTAAVGAAGGWALRRGLRGSTEALWLVFAGFVSADWFAACGLGLLGLDGLSAWQVAVPWWLLLSITSAGVGTASRRLADRPVVTLEVVAGLALLPVVGTVGQALGDAGVRVFWLLAIVTVLASAVVVTAQLLSQRVWVVIAALAGAATGAAMLVAAVAEAADHRDPGAYVGDAHGLPLLLVTLATAALAAWRPARDAAVTFTVLLVALLVALPLTDPLDGHAWFVWLSVLVVVLAVLRLPNRVGRGSSGTGLLVGGGVLTVLVVSSWSSGLAPVLVAIGESFLGPQDQPFLQPAPEVATAGRLAPWATFVGGAGLAALLGVVAAWPDPLARRARRQTLVGSGLVAAVTAVALLAEAGVALVALAAVVVAIGVGLVAVARRCGAVWELVGLVLIAAAPVLTVPTWDGLMTTAGAVLVVLLVLAVVGRARKAATSTTSATALWTVLLAVLAVSHPDVELGIRPAVSIVLVVSLLLVVVGAALQQEPVSWRPGLPVEAVGAVAAGATLAAGVATSDAAWLAAWCTGTGVTAVAVGLLVPGRRWVRFPGAALLGVAWVLRLVASDISTVEAYTVPFAVVALGVGVVALRRDEGLGTFTALGGGLALALVPSTAVALADPVSVRALVIGSVAFGLLVLGLVLRLQAPFVLGGAALALIAVVELAPYGWALPRWVLIGVAGLLLLLGGITWEDRVRDGRAAARLVRSMR